MVNKVNLQRWRKHLKCAAVRGITLAQYARENGLSRHTLYAASQQQRAEQQPEHSEAKSALTRKGRAQRSAFIAVRLPEVGCAPERIESNGTTVLQARLPNGVQIGIEVDAAQSSPGASTQAPWTQVLQALAALPCSR